MFLEDNMQDAVNLLREMAEHVDRDLRNLPETSSSPHGQQQSAGVSQSPQQPGCIEFTLEPIVKRQSKRMGVHKRVFETTIESGRLGQYCECTI